MGIPIGAVFVVSDVLPCHHADLNITALDQATNAGPMLCRYRPEFQYSVTSLNQKFVEAAVAAGAAGIVGMGKARRKAASVRVG